MRPAWRRVAERGDTEAFSAEEISQALAPALEQDCRADMTPKFLDGIRRVVAEPSLFRDDGARLQALRPEAGFGIGRVVLDNVELLSGSAIEGFALLQEAVEAALQDRAARGARQAEEHYLRQASAPRANNVRERLGAAITRTDFGALAARVLSVDVKTVPASLKKRGLDDGVTLP